MRFNDDEGVPPISSVAWAEMSQSVLNFLETPRDWETLEDWIRTTHFGGTRFRHVLAWLEQQRLAATFVLKEKDGVSEKLYWVNSRWISRLSSRPPQP